MRVRSMVGVVLGLAVLAGPMIGQTQNRERLNPMIALLEKGLPIFGVTHPAITAGRGRGGRGAANNGAESAPAPQPVLADVARETVAYKLSDFEYNSYSPTTAQRFKDYMAAILAAGGSMKTHAFISKVPIVATNPEAASARIIEQLNAGHAGIMMQRVETAEEVKQAIAAMRFRSKGGIRPETGIAAAAKYWGLTEAQYLEKADVWPLNPNGELVLWVIVESKEGIANVREIAALPGVSSLIVGAGTLGGVYSTRNAAGERVRDQEAFDAGVAAILAACKEFRKACSHPANDPAEIEKLMSQGFSVFTMQRRDQRAFDAVETGRRLSKRSLD